MEAERNERIWIGITAAVCGSLLLGSMFLVALYFRIPIA